MDSPISLFTEIYENQENYDSDGSLKPSAIELIRKIDFLSLSIDEISIIEDADKLPDDLALSILKTWMHRQNDIISNIRGKLLYTPEVEVEKFVQFINSMKSPSNHCDCIVDNILFQISTGGGVFEKDPSPIINIKDPSKSLIGFEQSKSNNYNDGTSHSINNLFDFKKETYYVGPPSDNSYVIITLPSFLKVNLTSYKLTAPPKIPDQSGQGGIKSWIIYGFNQKDEKIQLDIQDNNMDLLGVGSSKVFNIKSNNNQYFRSFQIINKGPNHQSNKSIILSGFDISGNLIIEDD